MKGIVPQNFLIILTRSLSALASIYLGEGSYLRIINILFERWHCVTMLPIFIPDTFFGR